MKWQNVCHSELSCILTAKNWVGEDILFLYWQDVSNGKFIQWDWLWRVCLLGISPYIIWRNELKLCCLSIYRADNHTTFMCPMPTNSGSLNLRNPEGPVQACMGVILFCSRRRVSDCQVHSLLWNSWKNWKIDGLCGRKLQWKLWTLKQTGHDCPYLSWTIIKPLLLMQIAGLWRS